MQIWSLGRELPHQSEDSAPSSMYPLLQWTAALVCYWFPFPRLFTLRINVYFLIHLTWVQLFPKYVYISPQLSVVYQFSFAHICVCLLGWGLWHTLSSDLCPGLHLNRPMLLIVIHGLISSHAVQYLRDSGPFGGVNKADHMVALWNYSFLLQEGMTKAA